jgi:predicted glutamine amidotransferase
MCVIVYSFTGKKEKEDNLKRMFEENPHGIGFAYKDVKNQSIIVKKGFMKLDEFLEFYKNFPDGVEHTIHFRLASAGSVSPIFTHPFALDKIQIPPQTNYKATAVLFHNGNIDYSPLLLHILPFLTKQQRKKLLSLNFSDTYILSLYISIFKVPNILKHLKSKFLIFSSQSTKIYGFWEKEESFYYSNTSWKVKKYFFTRSYYYEPIFHLSKEKDEQCEE